MPMRALTVVILTVLLMAGLPAKADISLEALEAGSGVRWPQALRDQVVPSLGALNEQEPHRAVAVSVNPSLDTFAVGSAWKAPTAVMASQGALQSCEQDRAGKGLEAPCEILISDDAIIPLGRAYREAVDLTQGSQVWRVTSPKGTLYLVGSIHAMKPSLFPLPPVYEQAYQAAEQLAGEVNPLLMTDPARMSALQSLPRPSEKILRKEMPKDLKKTLEAFFEGLGAPRKLAYSAPPLAMAMELESLTLMSLGYSPQAGFEAFFARRASQEGKPFVELEDPVAVLGSLMSLPLPLQFQALVQTFEDQGRAPDLLGKLLTLWYAGDPEALFAASIEDLATLEDAALLQDTLFDRRNAAMTKALLPLLKNGKTTFAMVGAGHLGGPKGMLAMLREAGYAPVQLSLGGDPLAP
ncbi:MAG: TraB/GumN family protein [Pseudomonadales bacterium]|jgi:hypothetical protein